MLRILGRNNSSNVQKVLWCCDELGIPFTREDYGGAFGKTTEAPYLELNPNSRVPTIIEDDTFVLWESNVIVRYLADKYGKGGLMPRDPRARADADRWMDWQQTTVLTFMTPLFGVWCERRKISAIPPPWPPIAPPGRKFSTFSTAA